MRLNRDAVGDFVLDSAFLAERLGTDLEALRRGMRLGQVTSRVEQGNGKDAGRIRITVRARQAAWQAILDQTGEILSEKVVTTQDQPGATRDPPFWPTWYVSPAALLGRIKRTSSPCRMPPSLCNPKA